MRYCSVDLELTGFDPLKDEILEIGLAFFEPGPNGLVVTEKFSQLFRPNGEVHPKILGLTGITTESLAQAPQLSELREVVQNHLNDSIILGHNIVLDAKFLEAFGFKLSGKFIDTLDLVQFLLPTHHSYNLENLMHYFGIAHEEAHRALGDSLATISLLEQLIKKYQNFPETLKQQISELTKANEFLWQPLLAVNWPLSPANTEEEIEAEAVTQNLPVIEPGKVTLVPFDQTSPKLIAAALQNNGQQYLLVVDDKHSVLKLWQQKLAHGLFSPHDLFNEEKFTHLLQQTDMSLEQTMFCLKILVWKYTNWQTETIIDLNLSFFGGQFRSLVNQQPIATLNEDKLIVCDYETFMQLSEQKLYTERTPILWTAQKLEQWLSEGSQGRLTWNKVLYLLKNVYNPETGFGRIDLKKETTSALAAADLFFSLVSLEMSRSFRGESKVTFEKLASNDFVFKKLRSAAANFGSKLEVITAEGQYQELAKVIIWLNNFFEPIPDRIKWIEVSEVNCLFVDRPLHIAPLLNSALIRYPVSAVIENLPNEQLLLYFLNRLGLSNLSFTPQIVKPIETVELVLQSPGYEPAQIMESLKAEGLPAIVVFPNKLQIREFYDDNYSDIKQFATVFAQSYSGGSNKILRNFTLRPNSVLLATADFISRSSHQLSVETVVMTKLPTVAVGHPYIEALQQHWNAEFPNFLELQSWLEFYLLFQKLYSPRLKRFEAFVSDKEAENLSMLPFFRPTNG